MKKLIKSILCLSLFFMLACQDSSEDTKPDPLVEEINALKTDIDQNRVLTKATEKDKKSIDELLIKITTTLMALNKYPEHKQQLQKLIELRKELEEIPVPLRDERLKTLLNNLGARIGQSSALQKLDIFSSVWPLKTYDFSSSDLSPFYAPEAEETTSAWEFGIQTTIRRQSFATVKQGPRNSRGTNSAWLMSPSCDLRYVQNPQFRIRHSIYANREDPGFDRLTLMNNGFKAKVSTNYNSGDPNNAQWTELPLDLPLGQDFHSITTSPILLNKYKGKNVTVALQFDYNSKLFGYHFTGWQVEEFVLLGAGAPPKCTQHKAIKPLYSESFSDGADNLTLWNKVADSGAEWAPGKFRDKDYMQAKTNNKDNESWMISKAIKLPTDSQPELKFDYTLQRNSQNYPILDRLQLLVSTNYEGKAPESAQWTPLTYHDGSEIEVTPGRYQSMKSEKIDLKAYAGEDIHFAFKMITQIDDDHLWRISDVKIFSPVVNKEE